MVNFSKLFIFFGSFLTTNNTTIADTSELNVYLVGGAVRDQLLNRAVKDHDYLVVGATVDKMLSLGFKQVGKDFPVFLHPNTKDEYALARTEKKQGQGYTGFTCYAEPDVTIEQDLFRRDLTVNAMAKSQNGEIIDPYNGQQDIKNRILRHVSNAFIEDPLRVLRVARFAARYYSYGFTIADETIELMTKISTSGELSTLSAERVWQEMERSLSEDISPEGISPEDANYESTDSTNKQKQANPEVFFQILHQCQALKVIWPELDILWGIPNPAQWHPEICSGVHTMMVLQQAVLLTKNNKNKTAIRFAALCHDLGKGLTASEHWPSHRGHEKAGLPLVEKISKQLKIPTYCKQLALKVCEHHLHCHKAYQLKPSTLLKIFNQLDVWRKPQEFDDFLIACKSDFLGRLGFENRPYPQEEYLKKAMLAASQVNAKIFVEQGLQGIEIKEAIAKARLNTIKKIKDEYKMS